MAVNETIVTGRKFRKCIDAATKAWQRISFWTKSSDVEFEDGKNAETKLGAIDGITDSLEDTSSRLAASAKAISTLNNNLGGCQFTQEGNDFYIVGADSVRKKLGSALYYLGKTKSNMQGTKPSATSTSFNVSAINGYQSFTVDNFIASANGYGLVVGGAGYYASVTKTYNPSTGILTVNTPATYFAQINGYTYLQSIDVYLCTGDILKL